MRIQHNILAQNSYRNYNNNTRALGKNLERLSSGYKINRAGDDAAGLAISEKMRAQITGLNAAQKNVKDGISLVKTAEGAMQEVQDMLNRMDYLATQSANGTYDDDIDRAALQKEVEQLKSEINRIADSANFNGIKLLDGSLDTNIAASVDMQTASADLTVGSALPGLGNVLGADTVLHNEKHENTGTEFDVALHNFNWDAVTGNAMSLKVGDTYFELYATGSVGTISGSDLAKALLGGIEGVDVTIKDADGTVQWDITGGKEGGPLTIKINGQDFTVSVLEEESYTLRFVQNNPPTNEAQEVNGALPVRISGVNAAVTAMYSIDLRKAIEEDDYSLGTVVKIGTSYACTFNNTDITDVDEMIAAISADIAAGMVDVEGFEAAISGDTLILTAKEVGPVDEADVPVVTIQRVKEAEFTIPPEGISAGAPTAYARWKLTFDPETDGDGLHIGTINYYYNSATANANGGSSFSQLEGVELINVNRADFVIKTVTYNTEGKWEIIVEALGGSGEYPGSKGNDVANGNADGAQVATDLSGFIRYATAGSTNYSAFNTANIEQLTDYIGVDAVTAVYTFAPPEDWIWMDGAAITIDGTAYTWNEATSSFDGLPARSSYHEISYNPATKMFTVSAIDVGPDENPPTISYTKRLAGKAYKLHEDMKGKYAEDLSDFYTGSNGDWNISTTRIKDVRSGGLDRLASTKFELTEDMTAEGGKLTIGRRTYEFISDKSKQGQISDTGSYYVDISSGDLAQIAKNLTYAASGGDVWTVGFDEENPTWITLTETLANGGNPADNASLEDYLANVKKSKGIDLSTIAGIAQSLKFEGVEVKRGETQAGKALTLQIGDTSDSYNQMRVTVSDMHTKAMAYTDDDGNVTNIDEMDISTQESAAAAVDVIKNAINYVSSTRGDLGAIQNRLEHTQNNLSVMAENIQDAESTIRDTDIAEEMMSYVKNNILVQSAQAMLAQANQVPQGVLQLLG